MREVILSQQTLAEQAAGRAAIGEEAIQEVLNIQFLSKGVAELKRRFPGGGVTGPAYFNWDRKKPDAEWLVEVSVNCDDGTKMVLTDPFLGFPSDRLIAEIALVV